MQVLGSFTAFTIEWPDFVVNIFASLKTLTLMNPIQLSGSSCLFMDIGVDQLLHGYMLGLLGLMVFLALPLPLAFVRGYHKHDKHGFRFRQAQDKFWGKGTIMFSDGNSFTGDWVEGVAYGTGEYLYPNGNK